MPIRKPVAVVYTGNIFSVAQVEISDNVTSLSITIDTSKVTTPQVARAKTELENVNYVINKFLGETYQNIVEGDVTKTLG